MKGDNTPLQSDHDGTAKLLGSNQSGMRAHNERLVLSLVRRIGPLAKAEIARITGLSAQAVSVIMRALERDGLLERGEKVRGRIGQPSVPMKINPNGAYFFGLKVGRRSADVILTDFQGKILERLHMTYAYPTPDRTIEFAQNAITQLKKILDPAQQERIAGVGLAIPFFMWEWSEAIGVAPSALADWRQRDLRREISDKVKLPVYMENDGSSACGAELVFGDPQGTPDFLYFYVGYFIGGGMVLNNLLYTGPSGNAGALGPMPMPKPGAPHRQLVEVASLASLEDKLAKAGQNAGALWESSTTWPFEDAIIDNWVQESALALSHAIVTAISLIDFKLILIDGWMPEAVRTRLVHAVSDCVSRSNLSGLSLPEIRPGTVGPDARALGAASLPLSHRFMPET